MTLKVSTNNNSKLQKIKKNTNAPHTHTHTNAMIHTFEDTHKTQKGTKHNNFSFC